MNELLKLIFDLDIECVIRPEHGDRITIEFRTLPHTVERTRKLTRTLTMITVRSANFDIGTATIQRMTEIWQ